MTQHEDIARHLFRVDISRESIDKAWKALDRVMRCEHCKSDGLLLLMYFSTRVVESSRLQIENSQLADAKAESSERAANLLAAIRAAITADEDGEDDPLWYLRDEYAANSESRRDGDAV